MPDYDRQSAQSPERVQPPTPDEEERAALHCAAQYSRGDTERAQAAVIELKTAKKKRRRSA